MEDMVKFRCLVSNMEYPTLKIMDQLSCDREVRDEISRHDMSAADARAVLRQILCKVVHFKMPHLLHEIQTWRRWLTKPDHTPLKILGTMVE